MNRGHALTFGVLAALVIAVTVPRAIHHTAPLPIAPAVSAPEPANEPTASHHDIGFRTHALLLEHFERHGRELAAPDAASYLAFAQRLRDREVGGDVLELRRADGVITRLDRASGAFLAFDSDLTIRTCFKPHDGEEYFRRQAGRERH
jgi:pyocin large subunit-like protein